MSRKKIHSTLFLFAIINLITISYNVDVFAEDEIVVEFLEDSYSSDDTAVIRVTDSRIDDSSIINTVDVVISSDADTIGTTITLQETDNVSGIFEGTVFFVLDDYTSGHRLQVVQGGSIYVTYKDTISSISIEGTPSPITDTTELEETPSNTVDVVQGDSSFPSEFNIIEFGMFDAEDEGNLVDELQVGKTYWFRIWHQSELQTSQDVGILVQMIDKNKDMDNILQKIDGHSIHNPHDQMENGFEWIPKYAGEFLITVELFTKDRPLVSNYSEFEFVVYGNLSLKQQIENKMFDSLICGNDSHVLAERPNGKLACAFYDTVKKLDWAVR